MKLIFATRNQGKLREVKEILSGIDVEILSAEEVGIFDDVVEDGKTFEENALKKAKFILERYKEILANEKNKFQGDTQNSFLVMADDSGLCIKALGCFPGVHSARWAGDGVGGEEIAKRLLKKMKNVPCDKRDAYFKSVVALVSPSGEQWIFEGRVDGMITQTLRGKSHPKLPYDSIFIPKGFNKTFAEMSQEEKNRLSHRGAAFRKLRKFLSQIL
jgi:XTP/dITP diphosphohydrolase